MKHMQQKLSGLQVEHLGIVVTNRENAIQQLSSMWGIGPFRLLDIDIPEGIVHGKRTRCRAKLAFAQAGPIEIELIEPGEGESTWSEFLRDKGEGVQHVGTWIQDMDKELASYAENGMGVLQFGEDENVKFACMDTETVAGVVIELLQRK